MSKSNDSESILIMKRKFAMIGTLPPPYGGVSVHVARMVALLRNNDIPVILYEQTGKFDLKQEVVPLGKSARRFVWLLMSFSEDVIHFQFNKILPLFVASVIVRWRSSKRYLITVHSEKPVRDFRRSSWLRQQFVRHIFRNAQHLICVNPTISEFMVQTLQISRDRVSMIPAFLPPSDLELDPQNIPKDVRAFLSRHKTIVGTHGWFGYFVNGEHVYGFDYIARLAERIVKSNGNIGMYTVISGCYDARHRSEILDIQKTFADHWMIIEEPFSCAALYNETDIFVRPTLTDGDSVSIRECLSLGVSVLASDAVARPTQCHLFRSRDYDDFLMNFEKLMSQHNRSLTMDSVAYGFEEELLKVVHNAFDF